MKLKYLIASLFIFFVAGCVSPQPAKTREYYILEYAPPPLRNIQYLEEIVKMERFSVVQLYNSSAMVYRTGSSFSLNNFSYSRWKANPGDMVTDCLMHDLRETGLFRAVYSYRNTETTRFILEGIVTAFLEDRQEGNRKALMSLSITLLDSNQKEMLKKVVFQKSYAYGAPCEEEGPRGLARGLSESMGHLSGQIINDVYQAIRSLHNAESH